MSAVSAHDAAFMRAYYKDTFLNDTCTIERPTLSQNSTGEVLKAWSVVESGVRCRVIVKNQFLVSPERGEYIETRYELEVAYGTDVNKGDRVTHLTSTLNDYSMSGVLHINSVKPVTTLVALSTTLDVEFIPGSLA